MQERLWTVMGSNDPYYTLIGLDRARAEELEKLYTADYDAAPEREDKDLDIFAAAMLRRGRVKPRMHICQGGGNRPVRFGTPERVTDSRERRYSRC